ELCPAAGGTVRGGAPEAPARPRRLPEELAMPQPPSDSTIPVPRWLVVLGSVALAGHLFAVLIAALATPSGLWVLPDGINMTPPPPFALPIHQVTTPAYLQPLKMAHNYRFATNRPGPPGGFFEVRLKDQAAT